MQAGMHACIQTCMHAGMNMCMHACRHLWIYAYMHAGMQIVKYNKHADPQAVMQA